MVCEAKALTFESQGRLLYSAPYKSLRRFAAAPAPTRERKRRDQSHAVS